MAHRNRIAVVTKHLAGGQAASSLFNGSVTIITGAGRGIGREAALLFAMNGARLVLNDLDRWANKNISSPRFASRTLLVLTANGTSPSCPPSIPSFQERVRGRLRGGQRPGSGGGGRPRRPDEARSRGGSRGRGCQEVFRNRHHRQQRVSIPTSRLLPFPI